ncbi:MAG: hypothetical protein FJ267_05450 [Planctomycetes bacterium]|nr:hypothetical protein [Planctomycetota bacterium]
MLLSGDEEAVKDLETSALDDAVRVEVVSSDADLLTPMEVVRVRDDGNECVRIVADLGESDGE